MGGSFHDSAQLWALPGALLQSRNSDSSLTLMGEQPDRPILFQHLSLSTLYLRGSKIIVDSPAIICAVRR